jgi:hypothetical protein
VVGLRQGMAGGDAREGNQGGWRKETEKGEGRWLAVLEYVYA